MVICVNSSPTANRHLLRLMAQRGAGAFEYFDAKVKSRWESQVEAQLERVAQPALTSVRVNWQQFDENVPEPVQAPRLHTALFNGSRQVVYGFVQNCTQVLLKIFVVLPLNKILCWQFNFYNF